MDQDMILSFVGGFLKLKVNAKWEQTANCTSELFLIVKALNKT